MNKNTNLPNNTEEFDIVDFDLNEYDEEFIYFVCDFVYLIFKVLFLVILLPSRFSWVVFRIIIFMDSVIFFSSVSYKNGVLCMNFEQYTDEKLIAFIHNGNQEATEYLLKKYSP